MSKKKHKKKSPQQQKLEQAHQKNLYLEKIRSMMTVLGSPSTFNYLTFIETDLIYALRLRPVKIISSVYKGRTLDEKNLKLINDYLSGLLKNTTVSLGKEHKTVNLYDFFTYVETIYTFWRNACEINFPNGQKFKDSLSVFNEEYARIRTEAYQLLNNKVESLGWLFSDILRLLLWFEKEDLKPDGTRIESVCYNNFVIHFEQPIPEIIDINGSKRTIFPMGLSRMDGIEYVTVTPQELGMNTLLQEMPLKVYFQSHVVQRFKERLGPVFEVLTYMQITKAYLDMDVSRLDDSSFLFAVLYVNIKIGYLKADIVGDKLIFRTFLFLTNNGTPEGKKLAELIGIQIQDKKYLKIDTLDTFINSDIEKNECLKNIFCEAGCGGLFEIKKYIPQAENTMKFADHMLHYLGLEEKNELDKFIEKVAQEN